MDTTVVFFALVFILGIIAYIVYKNIAPGGALDDDSVTVRQYGKAEAQQSQQPPPEPEPAPTEYYQPAPVIVRPRQKMSMFPFIVIIVLLYLAHENDYISFASPTHTGPNSIAAEETIQREAMSEANFVGHTVVEGVNWFKIVATSTTGVPYEGWVSELAIRKEPPKENKAADAMMQKLGLPTNKERIHNIKKMRNVVDALKTALSNPQ